MKESQVYKLDIKTIIIKTFRSISHALKKTIMAISLQFSVLLSMFAGVAIGPPFR